MPKLVHSLQFTTHRVILLVSLLILIILLNFSLFTFHFSLLNAQSPLPQKSALQIAKDDYLFQFTKYQKAHEEYITASSNYLSYKTTIAKNDAFDKTKAYLNQVNFLFYSYIALVTTYGNTLNWDKTDFKKDTLDNILKEESQFISTSQQKVAGATSLEDFPPITKDLKGRIEKSTAPKINKITTEYQIIQSETAFASFQELTQTIEDYVNPKISDSNRTVLTNWQTEVRNIKDTAKESLDKAEQNNSERTRDDRPNDNELKTTQRYLQDAKQQLLRSKSLFEEILRVI